MLVVSCDSNSCHGSGLHDSMIGSWSVISLLSMIVLYTCSVLLRSIVKWQSNSNRLTQDNIVTTTKYKVTALLSMEVVNGSRPFTVG